MGVCAEAPGNKTHQTFRFCCITLTISSPVSGFWHVAAFEVTNANSSVDSKGRAAVPRVCLPILLVLTCCRPHLCAAGALLGVSLASNCIPEHPDIDLTVGHRKRQDLPELSVLANCLPRRTEPLAPQSYSFKVHTHKIMSRKSCREQRKGALKPC